MDFRSKVLFVVICLIQLSLAQSPIQFISVPESVSVGQTYTLSWSGGQAGQPVTIILKRGNANDLQTVGTITTTATGGSFQWTPDSSLATGSDYTFEITQGSETNYSPQFSVNGGSAATTSQSASTSTPTTTPTSTSTLKAQTSQTTTSSLAQQHSPTTELSSSISSTDSTSNSPGPSSAASTSPSDSSTQQPSPSQTSNPSTETTTSNPATASSFPSPGLTTGDKAAIGVGVPFGVLLLGAAFFFFGRLSKRSASHRSTGAVAITDAEKSELDGNGVPIGRSELPGAEAESGRRHELPESHL